MKNSLKFITLTLLILLAQSSLAAKYEAGNGSIAHSEESVAVGIGNKAGESSKPTINYYSSAVGILNEASGKYSSAFGYWNTASGESSSAVGNGNTASRLLSSAFGYRNTVSGESSSAVGNGNVASGLLSYAFGNQTYVSGEGSGAFGRGGYSSGDYLYKIEGNNSWAIGTFNEIAAGSDNNHILGNNVSVGAAGSPIIDVVVLGNDSTVKESQVISVGSDTKRRKIVHLAAGTNDTDAVNKKQMDDEVANYTKKDASNLSAGDVTAWKAKLGVGSGGGAVDAYTKAQTDAKLNVKAAKDGSNLSATDIEAWKTKLGVGSGGGAVDAYTKAESNNKFLDKVTYTADKATFATKTELGAKVNKDASNLSATDIAAWKAKLAVPTVSGIVNTASGTGSTGLGHGNVVTGTKSTAVGYKNQVSGNNSGAFGDPNIVTGHRSYAYRSYAFGNDNTIAGDDNFVMGSNVVIAAGITNSVALGNNSTVSGSNEVSVGSATNKRKITNVADGELSATSTDAVTGRQLYNAMQNSGSLGVENLRNEVNTKLTDMKSEINHVGSLSAALSALHPMQYDPQAPNQIMAGFGHYRNKQSIAVGMSHYFGENVLMTAGLAIGSERRVKTMANVGLTWKLGKGGSSSATNTPSYIVQDEMNRLARENNQLKAQVNTQARENQELKERMKNLEEKLEMILNKK